MSEWLDCTLGEAPIQFIDGDRGKNYPKKTEFLPDGYCLFLNAKNVTSDGFAFSELNFVDQQRDELLRKGKLKRGDVVLTTRGTVGNVAYYHENIPYDHVRINSGMVIVRPDGIDENFSYQLFKSLSRSFQIFATGSAQPQLPIRDLSEIPVSIPPLPEQEAIAAVLSSLDDKIDLLQRQNATLEAMAQTLFRQWFVEEAGDGWEDGTLNDVLTTKGGTTPRTKNPEFWNGDIYWTTPRDLSNNDSPYLLDTARKITPAGLAKISSGLLPKGTLLLSSRAPVGYLGFADIPLAINQGYIAILDDKGVSKYFLYLWLKENMDYVKSFANGSTFLEISKTAFKTLEISVPPAKIRERFDEIILPLFEKIRKNVYQIRTLEKLRDTLLPKLMSGEVRVKY